MCVESPVAGARDDQEMYSLGSLVGWSHQRSQAHHTLAC